MFDIGWSELLVLGSLALIVVGPKDLPGMLRTLGQTVGQAKRMAREFQRSMEDAAAEVDIGKDVGKDLREMQKSMSDFNAKIGMDAPRKYAEKLMNGEDDAPKPGAAAKPTASATPAPAVDLPEPPTAPAAAPEPAETRPAAPPPASGA